MSPPEQAPEVERPPTAAPRRRGLPWTGIGIGSTILIAALSCLAYDPARDALARPSAEAPDRTPARGAPPPVWRPITRPIALYDVEAPELKPLAPAYEARRRAIGGREDTLVYGAFAEEGDLHLRLTAARDPARETGRPLSFFIDLAESAAEAGLSVARSAPPAMLPTKFGSVEAADVALADASERERACLAFRLHHAERDFRVFGWLCGAAARPADRRQLACVIDRLALVNAGDDPALRALFAEAERRRGETCGGAHLTAPGRKTSWLDSDGGLPRLRGAAPAVSRLQPGR